MSIHRCLAGACAAPLFLVAAAALASAAPPGLDVRARGEISRAIGDDSATFAMQERGTSVVADNPAHALRARFEPDGVAFAPGFGLALESWRCGASLHASGRVEPRASRNTVEYRRGALSEWYVNGPFGIQQGLTFDALPASCRDAPLVIRYRTVGAVRGRQVAADAVEFGPHRYAGLHAYDAANRVLPARMSFSDGGGLELVVDVGDARMPVVVDPFVETAKLPSGDAEARDYGVRVAVSGDTVLIGAHASPIGGVAGRGAAYVFVRTAQGWVREARLLASDGALEDHFGIDVSLSRDVAIVGSVFDDGPAGADQGSAYVYERSNGVWTERQKLTAVDATAGATFGFATTTTSNGDLIAIGAHNAAVGPAVGQGKVYLFRRNGLTWTPIETLTAPDGAQADTFGLSVALSGGTLVVGAQADDVGANVDQGSAYVFVGDASDFAFQQKLVANDGAVADLFGRSVSVSGDYALIGASRGDAPGGIDQGTGYVFVRSGTTWTQQQELTFPFAAAGDEAGYATAIGEGIAVLGAFRRDTGGTDAGQIAVFRLVGGTWMRETTHLASDSVPGRLFGAGVGLDGARIAVGAPGVPDGGMAYVLEIPVPLADSGDGDTADPDGATDDQTGKAVATGADLMAVGAPEVDGTGVVYLYQLKGTGAVTPGCGTNVDSVLVATLTNTGGIGDKFGSAVAMSSDGNTIVVGSPEFNARGRIAVFTKPAGGWSGDSDITTADTIAPALVTGDKFGSSVSISDTGTIAAGAPGNDTQGLDAGAVMMFRPAANTYDDVPESTTVALTPQAGAAFGSAVSLSNNALVVGAPLEDNLSPGNVLMDAAGAAYAYSVAANGTTTGMGAMEPLNGGGIGDKFGTSVGVSGTTMIVGAPGTSTAAGADSGAGFLYEGGGGVPALLTTLVPEDGAGQQAGSAVAIAGEYVLLGAPLAGTGEMTAEGASYFFEEPEAGWENGPPPLATSSLKLANGASAFRPTSRVSPIKRQGDQAFGSAIGLTRRGLAVGAPLRDDDIPNCSTDIVDEGGADAYLFDRVFRDGFE